MAGAFQIHMMCSSLRILPLPCPLPRLGLRLSVILSSSVKTSLSVLFLKLGSTMSPSPNLSPPRGGRKGKRCSHSPPHVRGGNVSRGVSPVGNFDSSFSPRSIGADGENISVSLLNPALGSLVCGLSGVQFHF